MIAVERLLDLPLAELLPLCEASEREGFRFVRRLIDEWQSGARRYAGPGEQLFGARDGSGGLVGVCGLTRDPYSHDPVVGRLRHLYVLPTHRRTGVGAALVRVVVAAANPRFEILRLRAATAGAARLYESLGFTAPQGTPDCTHVMLLGGAGPGLPPVTPVDAGRRSDV